MSPKVRKYLIIDLIVMAIVTGLCLWGSHLCGSFANEWIVLLLKIVINGIWIVFDLLFVFFFLLYWWSDVEWTKVKKWARKKFK